MGILSAGFSARKLGREQKRGMKGLSLPNSFGKVWRQVTALFENMRILTIAFFLSSIILTDLELS